MSNEHPEATSSSPPRRISENFKAELVAANRAAFAATEKMKEVDEQTEELVSSSRRLAAAAKNPGH